MRRKKWPALVASLAILCSLAGLVVYKRHTKPPAIEKPDPRTWSQFNEQKRLQMLLQGFAIESIVDLPCCDLNILGQLDLGVKRYIGVIEKKEQAHALQAQFGSKIRTFLDRDITKDLLPKVDLILCWDYLCTLTSQEARAALLQFKKSGAKFLLMRHYPEVKENSENTTGVLQPINWKYPPYQFPEPIIQIMEKGDYGMENLALWNLNDL
ncbi:MAG: hypothetical protein K1000chlam2_01790 [Chlamydiae bacterium]|nr:hypothetical protein [Chlamydiota bacterium]